MEVNLKINSYFMYLCQNYNGRISSILVFCSIQFFKEFFKSKMLNDEIMKFIQNALLSVLYSKELSLSVNQINIALSFKTDFCF